MKLTKAQIAAAAVRQLENDCDDSRSSPFIITRVSEILGLSVDDVRDKYSFMYDEKDRARRRERQEERKRLIDKKGK